MKKRYSQTRHVWLSLIQRGSSVRWKKVISVAAILGVITTGFSSSAQAMTATPSSNEQLQFITSSKDYFSTHFQRNLGLDLPLVPVGSVTTSTSRCPAFKSWEDWIGGARVHAYVDFHPSDLCNGKHVKAAYVRLIRQCGPYYDSGRKYTYTASSPTDTRLYSVEAWILDSIIWSCNTNTYYGYDYF